MKTKELIVNFRYVFGNIACMSVSSTTGKPVENDINNEDAIKMFNALIGEKENSIIQENHQLKDIIEEDKEDIRHLLDIINHNCNELKCNSDEWLVLKGWQDRLKENSNE